MTVEALNAKSGSLGGFSRRHDARYDAFDEMAAMLSAPAGYYPAAVSPASSRVFSSTGREPGFVSSLLGFGSGAAAAPAAAGAQPAGSALQNDKVRVALSSDVQKATPDNKSEIPNSVDKQAKQVGQLMEAKRALTNPGPESSSPSASREGAKPSVIGQAAYFAAGTVGGILAVGAAGIVAPKLAAVAGAALTAKEIFGAVSGVGAKTPEATIIQDSAFTAEKMGLGSRRRGMGGYDSALTSRPSGPSPEQQARLASASGGIRVDPGFAAHYVQQSLGGIDGLQLNKKDPALMALNAKTRALSDQIDVSEKAMNTPVTAGGWRGVFTAQAAGLDVRDNNLAMQALIPDEHKGMLQRVGGAKLSLMG